MPHVAPLVFLASTTQDLESHRAAVHRELLGLDVLYRGMEYFRSRTTSTHDVIMDELVRCDLFIGLVAFWYGSMDPTTNLSFTELEYQTASREKIPALIFLMDERAPGAPRDYGASTENHEKLESFRKRLIEKHVIERFSTPEDLAAKVSHSVVRWMQEHQRDWEQMYLRPLDDLENRYLSELHSRPLSRVKHAIECLNSSSNRVALEHLYAVLYREDLAEDMFRQILGRLISSPDEPRVAQMLVNVARDIPAYRQHTLFHIGHRGRLDGRTSTDEELRCVLRHEGDPDPNVRVEVAHALGKFALKRNAHTGKCQAALARLRDDPDERVRQKVDEVERRLSMQRPNSQGCSS